MAEETICRACGKPISKKDKKWRGLHHACTARWYNTKPRPDFDEWLREEEMKWRQPEAETGPEITMVQTEEDAGKIVVKKISANECEIDGVRQFIVDPQDRHVPDGMAEDALIIDGVKYELIESIASRKPSIGIGKEGIYVHQSAHQAYKLDGYTHVLVGLHQEENAVSVALKFCGEHPQAFLHKPIKKHSKIQNRKIKKILKDYGNGPFALRPTESPDTFVAEVR